MIGLERCIGCKSCEAACKAEHGLGPTENRNRVVWLAHHDKPGLDFLALSCQHCERPACVRACPVNPKAITKHPQTGVVEINEALCTGCGECVVACPYGAMGYDQVDHHAVKCDLCNARREDGLRPACATVCTAGAISFGDRSAHRHEMQKQGRTSIDHDAFLLGPSNIYLQRETSCADSPGQKLQNRGFDTHLITGRPPAPHFHLWTHYAWQAKEMWPDMYVQMHPVKAAELQIADGDEVSIETAHGNVRAQAWLYAGMRLNTVFVPIGWDSSQLYHPWNSVNYLTDEEQRDLLSGHSSLKSYLCRVMR